jgi:hypothetical protein
MEKYDLLVKYIFATQSSLSLNGEIGLKKDIVNMIADIYQSIGKRKIYYSQRDTENVQKINEYIENRLDDEYLYLDDYYKWVEDFGDINDEEVLSNWD